MVTGLAIVATAVSSLFAESTLVRWTQRRRPYHAAWTVALTMFALASALLVVGSSNGWVPATFRAFYLLGAVLDVPWLALGTVALLLGPLATRRAAWGLVFFSGLAVGVLATAPLGPVSGETIPRGQDVFGAFPRVLAAVGSGIGATVIVVGAVWSLVELGRNPSPRDPSSPARRLVVANVLIALGTLVLSGGGLLEGIVGHDEAFAITLVVGISVIYAGFLVADRRPRAAGGIERPGAAP